MEKFWEQVSICVSKQTTLDPKQLLLSLENQKDTIVNFLSFNCNPDSENDKDVADIKRKIYRVYTEQISIAISKAEVYYHDLSAESVEAIFELLKCVSGAELAPNEERKGCYENVLLYAYFLEYTVQIPLIQLLLKRVAYYKRNLKNFNRKTCRIQGVSFDKYINPKIRKAKKSYKKHKKAYGQCIERDFFGNRYDVKFEEIKSLHASSDFNCERLIQDLENIIKTYEDNYPEIISSKYKMSKIFRAFKIIFTIVSVLLLVGKLLIKFIF